MTELRELFDMTTTQIDPDLDAWKQQEDRQRRRSGRRRFAAIATAAAFAVTGGLVLVGIGGGREDIQAPRAGTRDALIVDPGGTVIGTVPALPEDADWLAMSPDGHTLAFTSSLGHIAPAQVYTIQLDGSGLTRLTQDPHGVGGGLDWSSDGTRIAYESFGESYANEGVFTMTVNGTHVTRVANETGVSEGQAVWGPDDRSILYGVDGEQVRTIAPSGGPSARLSGVVGGRSISYVDAPDWAGGVVTFVGYPDDIVDGNVYVATGFDGRDPSPRVTRRSLGPDAWELWAKVSPAGDRLAVGVLNRDRGSADVWLIPVVDDGSEPVLLAHDARSVTWLPDGRGLIVMPIDDDPAV